MAIVVAYKFAPNPQDAVVGSDGVVDWSRAKAAVSEYDPIAMALGRTLADGLGTELVAISVGGAAIGSSAAKKAAMSRGADRGILLADDEAAQWNPTQVASALAQLVGRVEGAQVILTGDSSIDDGNRMMGPLVAGFLGVPCFEDVTSVSVEGENVTLTQNVPGGTRTVTLAGTVVIATSSDAVEVKPPSMKEILAAGKKPVETLSASDVEVSSVGLTRVATHKPEARERKHQIFAGESAPAELIAALRGEGIL